MTTLRIFDVTSASALRPPWWKPFARRRWARLQMALNLILVTWCDQAEKAVYSIPPGGVVPSGGSGRLPASPPYMEVGET